MITVVGLGYGKEQYSLAAQKVLKKVNPIFVRTQKTEAGAALKNETAEYLDGFFEKAENFNDVSESIASYLIEKAQKLGDIVYCVDGDGYCDETVAALAKKTDGYQILSAGTVSAATDAVFSISATGFILKRPMLDTRFDVRIYDIADACLASEVKLILLDYYEPETQIQFFGRNAVKIPLIELDRQKTYPFNGTVFISGKEYCQKTRHTAADLKALIERLTSPSGCPWDREQTHESIRVNLIEEAYEAAEAITSGDTDHMEEEFGDCLLQTFLHADIAERKGEFTFNDIVSHLTNKLIFRHPHVFAGQKASNGAEALSSWEGAKQKEKEYSTLKQDVSRVPENYSALLKAEKVLKKIYKKSSLTPEDISKKIHTLDLDKDAAKLIAYTALYAALKGTDAEIAVLEFTKNLAEKTDKSAPDEILIKG